MPLTFLKSVRIKIVNTYAIQNWYTYIARALIELLLFLTLEQYKMVHEQALNNWSYATNMRACHSSCHRMLPNSLHVQFIVFMYHLFRNLLFLALPYISFQCISVNIIKLQRFPTYVRVNCFMDQARGFPKVRRFRPMAVPFSTNHAPSERVFSRTKLIHHDQRLVESPLSTFAAQARVMLIRASTSMPRCWTISYGSILIWCIYATTMNLITVYYGVCHDLSSWGWGGVDGRGT